MNELIEVLKSVDKIYVYFCLFICNYFENIFPPLPGDTFVVVGAYFVCIGFLEFNFTYLVTILGSIFGFMTMYYAGIVFKKRLIDRRNKESRFYKKMEKVKRWFGKYGYKLILFNRFFSGARTIIALIAGISRMNGKKVFFLALLSILIWNGILIYSGYFVGENWEILVAYLKGYNFAILAILAVIFIIYFTVKKNRLKWFG